MLLAITHAKRRIIQIQLLEAVTTGMVALSMAAFLAGRFDADAASWAVLDPGAWWAFLCQVDWGRAAVDATSRSTLVAGRASGGVLAQAVVGVMSLWIARTSLGARAAVSFIVSLWSLVAVITLPYGLGERYWIWAALGLALVGVVLLLAAHVASAEQATASNGFQWSYLNAFIWPTWIALATLGWAWINDFSARGPDSTRFLGLYQADAVWTSGLLICMFAALSESVVKGCLSAFVRCAEFIGRRRGPYGFAMFLLGFGVFIAWIGRSEHQTLLPGLGKPHVSGEIFKLMFFFIASWIMYRLAEWGATRARAVRIALMGVLVATVSAAGLFVSQDFGPGLIVALTGMWLLALLLARSMCHGTPTMLGRPLLSGLIACAVVMVWAMWVHGLSDVAPMVSDKAKERALAVNNCFGGPTIYCAQIRWLIDATPEEGFGLGKVPWCGARAALGIGKCTAHSGMPIQTPSDYAFAGLVATYGKTNAIAFGIALLCWFALLARAVLLPVLYAQRVPHWTLFAVWIIVVPVIGLQAQALITIAANMGQIPLTGVTLPVLGYGLAALLALTPWVGIALNPVGEIAGADGKRISSRGGPLNACVFLSLPRAGWVQR